MGDACVKLHQIKKTNRRISNVEGWNRFAKSFLKQTEYIHSTFLVVRWMFDVHQFFLIKLAVLPRRVNFSGQRRRL